MSNVPDVISTVRDTNPLFSVTTYLLFENPMEIPENKENAYLLYL